MRRRSLLKAATAASMLSALPKLKAQGRNQTIDAMPDYGKTHVNLIKGSTPATDGYYYPPEWEKHDFNIMVMPPPQNWKGSGIPLSKVRSQWARVSNQLAEYEPVMMVVRPDDRVAIKRIVSGEIELVEFPVNDGWSRDSGPMFVVDGKGRRRVAGFTFNGWGAKFPPYKDDALLKARLCKHLDTSMYEIDFVLEGGAVTVDGEGTLITTEQCLLNANRNKRYGKAAVEKILQDSLGISKVIWLGKGLVPDPVTDGHIDGMCAFVKPGSVMLHTTSYRRDPNYKICQDAKKRLESTTDAKGRKLEIVEVPLDGDISYMNFYIANGAILVPTTGDPLQDERPLGIIKDMFGSKYKVIGINSVVLGEGGGGIHCITQQVPKV